MFTKLLYLFFGFGFMVMGNSFIPHGKWIIQNKEFPYFLVNEEEIKTISENSEILLKTRNWKNLENNMIYFELENLQLIKKPNDWYNLKKYFRFINIYNKIKMSGVKIFVEIFKSEAKILYTFDDKEYNFFLIKTEQ